MGKPRKSKKALKAPQSRINLAMTRTECSELLTLMTCVSWIRSEQLAHREQMLTIKDNGTETPIDNHLLYVPEVSGQFEAAKAWFTRLKGLLEASGDGSIPQPGWRGSK